nr:transcription factor, MADS-box [Tanacetum cinerariifolium]
MVSSTSAIINKRSSKGRQKIEVKKIEAKSSRQVTFSKRRAGLLKKAVELCVLTGAKVAVLVKSPGSNIYLLGEDLIDWYLKNRNDVVETGQLGFPTNKINECYGDVSQELAVDNSSNSEDDNDSMMIDNSQAVLDSDEMKKNVVVEDDNDSMMIDNSQAVLDSDEMKKNVVVEDDNDSMMIDNLSLDMSWSDSDTFDMSWLDSDMSWINNYPEHGDTHTFDMNFHHGVEV